MKQNLKKNLKNRPTAIIESKNFQIHKKMINVPIEALSTAKHSIKGNSHTPHQSIKK